MTTYEKAFGSPIAELNFLQSLETVGTAFWYRFEYIKKKLLECEAKEKELALKTKIINSLNESLNWLETLPEKADTESYNFCYDNYIMFRKEANELLIELGKRG